MSPPGAEFDHADAVSHRSAEGKPVLILFLFIVIAAVVLGFVGVLVKGVFYLTIIGIVLFVLGLAFTAYRGGRRRQREHERHRH